MAADGLPPSVGMALGVDRLEVSKGPGGSLYGSDAIGGVVNLITKRPGGEPHTSAAFSGESFGTWTGSATQSGDWRGTGVSLGYSGFATDGDWEFQPVDSVVDGVVHYCVTNMPGAVPRSATQSLSATLLPYVQAICEPDWKSRPELLKGINIEAGDIIHPALKELLE